MRKHIILLLLILSFVIFLLAAYFSLSHARDTPINVNYASEEALEGLPGIGPVLAERIIDGRPYVDIYELERIKGIGDKTMVKLRDKVVTK